MPANLELKVKVDGFKPYIERLLKAGAVYTAELNQKDIYYKNKKGLLKLRVQNGNAEFIYYNRDEKGSKRYSDYSILKFETSDCEKFFTNALETTIIVKKKRLLYMYNNTRIHLDKVTGLGNFLELETLVLNGKKDAEKRFKEVVEILKLDMSSQIKKSYSDLLKAKNK